MAQRGGSGGTGIKSNVGDVGLLPSRTWMNNLGNRADLSRGHGDVPGIRTSTDRTGDVILIHHHTSKLPNVPVKSEKQPTNDKIQSRNPMHPEHAQALA